MITLHLVVKCFAIVGVKTNVYHHNILQYWCMTIISTL